MDFTREPIIQSVITPREGCKLVVRSSKSSGQEEYFVDAVEIISFGHSFFFRSLERPKAFLVPVSDYEILEVREARMVLKNVGIDRAIKIGGGRDAQMRNVREQMAEKVEPAVQAEEYVSVESDVEQTTALGPESKQTEARIEKKRDRRRHYRRRRGREEGGEEIREPESAPQVELSEPRPFNEQGEPPLAQPISTTSFLTSLLPPPPTLISETIARYKDNALFKGAFYSKEEQKVSEEAKKPEIGLEPPDYGSFEVSEEEEERIYQQRKQQHSENETMSDDDANSSPFSSSDDNMSEESQEVHNGHVEEKGNDTDSQ